MISTDIFLVWNFGNRGRWTSRWSNFLMSFSWSTRPKLVDNPFHKILKQMFARVKLAPIKINEPTKEWIYSTWKGIMMSLTPQKNVKTQENLLSRKQLAPIHVESRCRVLEAAAETFLILRKRSRKWMVWNHTNLSKRKKNYRESEWEGGREGGRETGREREREQCCTKNKPLTLSISVWSGVS
jgi:hypothetical protein